MLAELAHLFRYHATFFDVPVELSIEGKTAIVKSSSEMGGFSRTFFDRGTFCETDQCKANCCRGLTFQYHFWFDDENQPEYLGRVVEIEVNRNPLRVRIHKNIQTNQCDLLSNNLCILHQSDRKPLGCMLGPQIGLNRRYPKYLTAWFKTLPGRNFLWPKCPVKLNTIPIDWRADVKLFRRFEKAIGKLEHQHVSEICDLIEYIRGDSERYRALSQQSESLLSFDYLLSEEVRQKWQKA